MNCRNWIAELVECARTGLQPGVELQRHLRECSGCSERWEDERNLSVQFRSMRNAAATWRQPDAQRDRIMREFELERLDAVYPTLRWALSAAAVLLVSVALVYDWQSGRPPVPALETNTLNIPRTPDIEELPVDGGFVAVPYAPPLAPGEFVRVVRTELRPIALARMGIYVNAVDLSDIPTDVLVGEDGFPRAVRVIGEVAF